MLQCMRGMVEHTWPARLTRIMTGVGLLCGAAVASLPHATLGQSTRSVLAADATPALMASDTVEPGALIAELSRQTDLRVRRQLAIRLMRSPSAQVTQAVIALLSGRNNDPARIAVCEALAETRCQEPAYQPALLAIVQSRETAMALRTAAAAALLAYRDLPAEARDKLKAFRQEHDAVLLAESHAALMKALYDCTPERDRVVLLQAWLKQPLALERYTALDLIQQTLHKSVPDQPILEQIRTLLTDPDDSVRQKSVFVLRTLGQREDAPRLHAMLQQQQPAAVREAIYSALGVLGNPSSIPDVIGGLNDRAPSVVAEAATALARLIEQQPAPSRNLVEDAVAALTSRASGDLRDATLRERLIDAMATIADPCFTAVLSAHAGLEESVPAVRQAAIRGLGRSGQKTVLPLIVQQLSADPDAGVRESAAEAVGALADDASVLGALRGRLDSREEPSASVQNKAWDAYLQIVAKLPFEQQERVIAEWKNGPGFSNRRIELMAAVEKQATDNHATSHRLAPLREALADALIAAGRSADAGPVLSRALEDPGLTPPERRHLTDRMMDAYLGSSPEKSVAAAATIHHADAREAAARKLLAYLEARTQRDSAAAALVLERIQQAVPDEFGPAFAPRFDRLRRALASTTRPATAPTP